MQVNTEPLDNLNVSGMEDMPTPEAVRAQVPLTPAAAETVASGRMTVRAILDRKDPRLFVVIGPCRSRPCRRPIMPAGSCASPSACATRCSS
jgi:3-deoxy-7-phosphoheptulonate synthase